VYPASVPLSTTRIKNDNLYFTDAILAALYEMDKIAPFIAKHAPAPYPTTPVITISRSGREALVRISLLFQRWMGQVIKMVLVSWQMASK